LEVPSAELSIIEAVATGDHTWKGITNRTGRSFNDDVIAARDMAE